MFTTGIVLEDILIQNKKGTTDLALGLLPCLKDSLLKKNTFSGGTVKKTL